MKNILLITSSPRGEASHSTHVARDLVVQLKAQHPEASIVERDLWSTPPPIIGEAFTHAMFTSGDARTSEQRDLLATSDELIAELQGADILVLASGMINFGVPTALKAWFDQVVRGGVTFRYGESGPEGLLKGKKAYLVTAYGGVYSSGPMQALDFQAPYIKNVLEFIGIEVVETVVVEGVAMGPEAAQLALDSANEKILALSA